MSRLLLVHWNAAEAKERAARLRRAGHTVTVHSDERDGGVIRRTRDDPPDACIVDLSRLPAQGRAVGVALRQGKATRRLPLLFLGGRPGKVAATRKLLPDAVYGEWRAVKSALQRALARPPEDPVVPDTMAGYAGTPLAKKLGIKPDTTIALLGAPKGLDLAPPAGVTVRTRAQGRFPLLVLFVRSVAELRRRFPAARRALDDGGRLWIAWPKQASGVATDLSSHVVRRFGLDRGLVDFKVCAIDATWSGLAFARRGR